MTKATLVVAVRGWTSSGEFLLFGRPGGELRADFLSTLADFIPDAEIWAPELDLSMFSMRSAELLSRSLFLQIDEKLRVATHIEHIVILGFSSGSLLARRVFCMAHGAAENGMILHSPASWADKIDRMVMLSGVTRGWEFSSACPAHVRFLGPLLNKVASIVGWWKAKHEPVESTIPLIYQFKRGSPFVVSSRIQYVNVFEELRRRRHLLPASLLRDSGLPSTIFLLGAKDEFISPADCTELGPRAEFVFIELKGSNHIEALEIAGDSEKAQDRRERLIAAIKDEFETLTRKSWTLPPGDIDDYLDPMDIAERNPLSAALDAEVRHAVIIVHGIRDNGFWTKRVAREVKSLGREHGIAVRAPTPSYGYFSMWDFVRPGGREQAAFWFMERYADVRSHFPHAKISFVGHSNGTYIAARALELCSAVQLENVVFTGSVVRRDYCWSRHTGQVRRILNYVGSIDGVVAFLPSVFEHLHIRSLDVGGAGAYGFNEANQSAMFIRTPSAHQPVESVDITEVRFVSGGHDAAIVEDFWPEIARFALLGVAPCRKSIDRTKETDRLFRWAPLVTTLGIFIGALLITLPFTVVAMITGFLPLHGNHSVPTAALVVVGFCGSLAISWLTRRFIRMW
ncbi:hypothetical protein [Caballeronia humi]|uniref:Alpha/beta hydrolase family protein n=1 Tax=Caballeronia humi TaxID=326474 RepID=A0A158JFP4_9BURK|nr:hypothetical protein [Caballeronia humi]SAL67435.1 Alpha/beta hydrolase family protein [Caballeronia humi]